MSYGRRPRRIAEQLGYFGDDALEHETANVDEMASGVGMAQSQVPPNPIAPAPQGVVLNTLQACIAGGGSPDGCARTLAANAATDKRSKMLQAGALAAAGIAILLLTRR